MAPTARGRLGAAGEAAAAAWYEAAGYQVVDRNWRSARGEIDLVLTAPGGAALVFCEVKTRISSAFGTPAEAVTPAKQRRLRQLAAAWLAASTAGGPVPVRRRGRTLRFDVASVTAAPDGHLQVEVLQGAF